MMAKIFGHAHWHVLQPQYKFRRDWHITFKIMHFLAFFAVVPLLDFIQFRRLVLFLELGSPMWIIHTGYMTPKYTKSIVHHIKVYW